MWASLNNKTKREVKFRIGMEDVASQLITMSTLIGRNLASALFQLPHITNNMRLSTEMRKTHPHFFEWTFRGEGWLGTPPP